MCVSPGTMAQFTFYRRASDEDGSRPHLDSITEDDDTIRDIDHVMDEMELDDNVAAVPVRQLAAQSKSDETGASNFREVMQRQSELQDMREADHVLRPLLLFKRRACRRPVHKCGSKTFHTLQKSCKPVEKEWFVPVTTFMCDYVKSQAYRFDFPDPPVRFALTAKAKGPVSRCLLITDFDYFLCPQERFPPRIMR